MYPIDIIRELNRAETLASAKAKREPFVVEQEDLDDDAVYVWELPELGDYVPSGWEPEEHVTYVSVYGRDLLFLDEDGAATVLVPSLSHGTYTETEGHLVPGLGYALTARGKDEHLADWVAVRTFHKIEQPEREAG